MPDVSPALLRTNGTCIGGRIYTALRWAKHHVSRHALVQQVRGIPQSSRGAAGRLPPQESPSYLRQRVLHVVYAGTPLVTAGCNSSFYTASTDVRSVFSRDIGPPSPSRPTHKLLNRTHHHVMCLSGFIAEGETIIGPCAVTSTATVSRYDCPTGLYTSTIANGPRGSQRRLQSRRAGSSARRGRGMGLSQRCCCGRPAAGGAASRGASGPMSRRAAWRCSPGLRPEG